VNRYKLKEALGIKDDLMGAKIMIDIQRELKCSEPMASVFADIAQWAYDHEYRHCADDRVYESKRTL
jgi:hypothetical protein